jgi:cell wall-associated NlpC family hydrolase
MDDASQQPSRGSTMRSRGILGLFRRAAAPSLALVSALSATALVAVQPASGDQLSNERAQAAQIQATIESTGTKISVLNQQYNASQSRLEQVNAQMATTKANIAAAKAQVAADTLTLKGSAVDSYMSAGTQQSSNPFFATNEGTYGVTTEYGNVVAGKLSTDMANLTNAQDALASQEQQLEVQQGSAQSATTQAAAAVGQAQGLQNQLNAALGQVNGQIAVLIKQQQAAQQAAQLAAFKAAQQQAQSGGGTGGGTGGTGGTGGGTGGGGSSTTTVVKNHPAPPPAPGASGAIAAAQSQLGTPYVWGGNQPGGFDFSGLVQWAWGRAGISLPHYSGSQMAATTPVSFSDIQPGDIIFYGPGGSEHEGMYIGGGMMVEATHTGDFVRDDPMRMNFVGIGRP